jgi:hypothetical protein
MFFGIFFSQPLARWFALSSFCLFIFEQTLFEKQLDRDLDILDGLVAAEVQNETVKHFEGPQPDEEQRTLEDTAGIPTGVSFDRRMPRACHPMPVAGHPPGLRRHRRRLLPQPARRLDVRLRLGASTQLAAEDLHF